ncbi:hypothetical protein PINS_up012077 [Pythium insidiosum]|nr:hypothetical protein PINS_up012077 [Pythium insidiosum]
MAARHVELSAEEERRERQMLRELKKFHSANAALAAPVASSLTKKRIRVPRPDVDTNPFCLDRQLADEYQLLNFNKNPRFYINTIRDSPRVDENPRNHSSFINDTADMLASSKVSPRVRAEFTGATAPTAFRPTDYELPSVVTVDTRESRTVPPNHPLSPQKHVVHRVSNVLPPSHDHYSAIRSKQTMTFGHRPHSAARMYDPLSSSVARSPTVSTAPSSVGSSPGARTPIRTGMSVMQLQELLTPSKKTQQRSPPKSAKRTPKTDREDERQSAQHLPAKSLEELEHKYYNDTYNPPRERKPIRFHPPTDQTTAQLIDKYRKLAVGKLP